MEVQINMLGSIEKKPKHNDHEDVVKPASEGNSSGSLNSDMSYNVDENNDDVDDDDDDGMADYDYDNNYDDDDDDDDDDDGLVDYDDDEDDEAHYLNMQAQFDNVDLPPGVEASFSWLDGPPATSTKVAANTHDHEIPNTPFSKSNDIASSSTSACPNVISSLALEKEAATKEQSIKKFENFKLFDIVDDFSDHHYSCAGFQGRQPPSTWTKKIQDEWKILAKDLPETIFVRAYETRMDLLRAVILGPAGTPYHDGLFVFDIHFPPTYPDVPPIVHYYSGGLRINPNLYRSGKVCLSLLNTWSGKGTEKWMPNNSTMLQVLVSIQALILNDKPFFNEPGYASRFVGAEGEKKSKGYNEDIFILSLKTMVYTLRRPPKHYEDLVVGHFCSRAHVILSACRGYMEGVQVGSTVNGGIADDKSGSKQFKAAVGKMVNGLVSNFSRYGATNCDQYRVES